MRLRGKILLTAVGALLASGLIAVGAETSARKKARYYYAAGIQEQAQNNEAAAYEYFKKAYQTDPTYSEGASAYGSRRLYIALDTLQSDTELDRSLDMMRDYIDRYPDDLYENLFYGYVAGQLGRLDESVRVLERTYECHPESSNILLQLSDAYARSNDLKKAIDAVDRYERQAGLSSPVTTRKISYMLAENDTVGAIREVTRLVASSPADPGVRILKGNVFDVVEMPDSAFVYYKQAEELDPESGAAKLALAGYYQARGDSAAYDNKMYEVLLTEDLDLDQKADLVAEYLQALIHDNLDRKRGDYLFSVLEEQYPHEPRVLDLSARYLAAKQNFKEAEEQISYALDLNPTNVTYWGQLMTYQAAGESPADALDTYERAKQHIVPDQQLKMYYASVAQLAKKYDKAEGMYREMIADIQPDLKVDSLLTLRDVRHDITAQDLDLLSALLTSLGDVYNLAGEKQKSYRMYENAIVMDESNSMAKNNYAYFLGINGGDLDKALDLSGQVMQGFDAENPTYIDTFAWLSFLKGDIDAAETWQLKAVEAAEKNEYKSFELYDHLGDILARKEKWNDAVAAWRKAVEIQKEENETDDPSYAATLKKIKDAEPKMTPEPPADKNAGNNIENQ